MVEPDLRSIDLVPMTALAFSQKEIDACATWPTGTIGHPCLTVVTTFGMGREIEAGDDILRGHAEVVAQFGLILYRN